MYWLKIGNVVVNLAQVTDVNLNVNAGQTTAPMVAISFASLALIDGELEGRDLYFSGDDAKAIRGYFNSLSGKHLTTLTDCSGYDPQTGVTGGITVSLEGSFSPRISACGLTKETREALAAKVEKEK